MFFKNKKGFNLVETVFYVAISSLLLLSLSSFYITSRRMEARNILISEVEFSGRRLANIFDQYISLQTGVIYPTPGQTRDSLMINTSVSSDNPLEIYLDSGVVYLKKGSASATRLTGQSVVVEELIFENLPKDNNFNLISFQVKIKTNNISNRQEYSYEKVFTGSISGRYQ